MNLGKNQIMPVYNDGCFTLYDIVSRADDLSPDYPAALIRQRDIEPVWYRELAIFDRTRLTFEQSDTELTRKVAIPRWNDISTACVCMIDGVQHKVFNCAHVISKQGYPETELTLISPPVQYQVYVDPQEVTCDDKS